MQASFFHVTENIMTDALEHYISQLQPPSQRFTHLSPFQVQKFWERVSLALLGQVSGSGPINFSEGAGLQITNMVLPLQTMWIGRGATCGKGEDNIQSALIPEW